MRYDYTKKKYYYFKANLIALQHACAYQKLICTTKKSLDLENSLIYSLTFNIVDTIAIEAQWFNAAATFFFCSIY